ncbi:unnamed protein product [Pelagomonas calceolata]|uniref:Uncharacterized protein n=1 Tax=Pelagomonas calceolata TaxID=35677 RepID=A0A8J2SBU6_9STRA|nr:unnamed protein product [Pelagomonas calceolata]
MPRHGIAFPRQSSGLIHGAARGVRNAFKSRAELQREADRRRVDVCIEELLSVVDSPPGTRLVARALLILLLDTPGDDWYQIRAAWSPDDQFIVGTSWDWYSTVLGVFDAATGALLDKFSINMDESGVNHQTRVDFVGFTGDCGDACQDLVASATLQEGDKKDETYTFANNLTYYDVVTLDADDARCQPTPAPVPAPHHSDGATALAAGLAMPALAALAL